MYSHNKLCNRAMWDRKSYEVDACLALERKWSKTCCFGFPVNEIQFRTFLTPFLCSLPVSRRFKGVFVIFVSRSDSSIDVAAHIRPNKWHYLYQFVIFDVMIRLRFRIVYKHFAQSNAFATLLPKNRKITIIDRLGSRNYGLWLWIAMRLDSGAEYLEFTFFSWPRSRNRVNDVAICLAKYIFRPRFA